MIHRMCKVILNARRLDGSELLCRSPDNALDTCKLQPYGTAGPQPGPGGDGAVLQASNLIAQLLAECLVV
jgi:hypothetical protein